MFCRFDEQIRLQQEIVFVGPSKELVLSAGSVTIFLATSRLLFQIKLTFDIFRRLLIVK